MSPFIELQIPLLVPLVTNSDASGSSSRIPFTHFKTTLPFLLQLAHTSSYHSSLHNSPLCIAFTSNSWPSYGH